MASFAIGNILMLLVYFAPLALAVAALYALFRMMKAMQELVAAQKEQVELLRALSQKLEPTMEKNNVSD